MKVRTGVRAGFVTVALMVGTACGGEESTTTTTSLPGDGQTVTISAMDNTFRPDVIEVPAGAEVVFVNIGRNDHDVIPADLRPTDELSWGVVAADFAPRDEYRVVFAEIGEYAYYCSIHGTSTVGMVGTITVTD